MHNKDFAGMQRKTKSTHQVSYNTARRIVPGIPRLERFLDLSKRGALPYMINIENNFCQPQI